jgi:hypothetical protein
MMHAQAQPDHEELLRKVAQQAADCRDEIMEAFCAKFGCGPDEVVQVTDASCGAWRIAKAKPFEWPSPWRDASAEKPACDQPVIVWLRGTPQPNTAYWCGPDVGWSVPFTPTHWIPLPPLPEADPCPSANSPTA